MSASIKVVIAEDQELVRGSFRLLIESAPDLVVVGEAATGEQAVDVTRRTCPEVVLMDVRMPVMDGIDATRLLCADPNLPTTRVIILTTFDLDEYVFAALHAGASGFLLKNSRPADLLTAVRVVAAGDGLLAPSVTRRLIADFVARSVPAHRPVRELAGITAREHDVLTLIGRGWTNGEIATGLNLSPATVKTHIGHLLSKLDARDRVHLVILAYQFGLVRPDPPPH